MLQFAAALRDVGSHLHQEHDSRYLGIVETAQSVPDLARTFAAWSSFADVSIKCAQLAAADLHRAGAADLPGVEQLTAFADNLVPPRPPHRWDP